MIMKHIELKKSTFSIESVRKANAAIVDGHYSGKVEIKGNEILLKGTNYALQISREKFHEAIKMAMTTK